MAADRGTVCTMSTLSLSELRGNLGNILRAVSHTGEEAIITADGKEIAVVISMADYERLHEHADVADALHLRDMREYNFTTMTLTDMLNELGVAPDEFITAGHAA